MHRRAHSRLPSQRTGGIATEFPCIQSLTTKSHPRARQRPYAAGLHAASPSPHRPSQTSIEKTARHHRPCPCEHASLRPAHVVCAWSVCPSISRPCVPAPHRARQNSFLTLHIHPGPRSFTFTPAGKPLLDVVIHKQPTRDRHTQQHGPASPAHPRCLRPQRGVQVHGSQDWCSPHARAPHLRREGWRALLALPRHPAVRQ